MRSSCPARPPPLPTCCPPQKSQAGNPLPAARKQSHTTSGSIERAESSGCGVVRQESEQANSGIHTKRADFGSERCMMMAYWPLASILQKKSAGGTRSVNTLPHSHTCSRQSVISISASLLTIMTSISEAGCEPSKIILLSSGGGPGRQNALPLASTLAVGLKQANGGLLFVLFSLPRAGKGLGMLANAFLA